VAYSLGYTLKDYDMHTYDGETRLWSGFLKILEDEAKKGAPK